MHLLLMNGISLQYLIPIYIYPYTQRYGGAVKCEGVDRGTLQRQQRRELASLFNEFICSSRPSDDFNHSAVNDRANHSNDDDDHHHNNNYYNTNNYYYNDDNCTEDYCRGLVSSLHDELSGALEACELRLHI